MTPVALERNAIAGTAHYPVRADELCFYPPVIEITESTPHPLPRVTGYMIALFLIIVVIWSAIGTVNITAIALGKVAVAEGNTTIQPLDAGTVEAVFVRNGELVAKGKLLVQLDETSDRAERDRLNNALTTAATELEESRALLARVNGSPASKCGSGAGGAQAMQLCQMRLESEWEEIRGKAAKLRAEVTQGRAELNTVEKQVEKSEQVVPMISRREAEFEQLKNQGFVSSYSAQDRMKERIEAERELETLKARKSEASLAVSAREIGHSSWLSEVRSSLTQRISKGISTVEELKLELTKAELSLARKSIRAPIDGRIQELNVKGKGEVVTLAKALMVLVPEASDLTIDVSIKSSDIGFVKVGQPAIIKLDTFPFTKYGYVEGKIVSISSDTLSDEKMGGYFAAEIKPNVNYILANDIKIPLSAGMTLTAEIATGQRRILEFVFDPIAERVSSSMHER